MTRPEILSRRIDRINRVLPVVTVALIIVTIVGGVVAFFRLGDGLLESQKNTEQVVRCAVKIFTSGVPIENVEVKDYDKCIYDVKNPQPQPSEPQPQSNQETTPQITEQPQSTAVAPQSTASPQPSQSAAPTGQNTPQPQSQPDRDIPLVPEPVENVLNILPGVGGL